MVVPNLAVSTVTPIADQGVALVVTCLFACLDVAPVLLPLEGFALYGLATLLGDSPRDISIPALLRLRNADVRVASIFATLHLLATSLFAALSLFDLLLLRALLECTRCRIAAILSLRFAVDLARRLRLFLLLFGLLLP